MTDFSRRLRSEIEYIGFNQKEFAAKVGINKRALETYRRKFKSFGKKDYQDRNIRLFLTAQRG